MAGELEEIAKDIREMKDAVPRFGSHSSSGIHIHGSGIVAIVVGFVGVLGIVVAVACVVVVSAWRDADMRDLTRVRGDVRELQAYRVQHGDRINELEAKNGKSDTQR